MKINIEYDLKDLSMAQVFQLYKFLVQKDDKENVNLILDYIKTKVKEIFETVGNLNIYKFYGLDSYHNFIPDPVKAFESLIEIESINKMKSYTYTVNFDPKDLRK